MTGLPPMVPKLPPHRYIHLSFNYLGKANSDAVQKLCEENAEDWIHYLPDCWIVKTRSTVDFWMKKLKSILGVYDLFLVVEINILTSWGWLPAWVCDWINKHIREEYKPPLSRLLPPGYP